MIEQIQIKAFQSHKKAILNFHKGLNVIVGISDSGKTAILRALRWVIWNRPGGEAFRSTFGGDTEVTIITEEGNAITRAKNKENLYQLNDTVFKAFGTDVPQEIIEALNIQEINFARQFDQPFMLTATAGEVAQHFNRIAHIEQIDISTKKVQSWIRELEQDIKADEKQIEKSEQELASYEYLERMEADLEVLEELEKNYTKVCNSFQKLTSLNEQIQNVVSDIEGMEGWLEMEIEVDAILANIEEEERLESEYASLLTALTKLTTIDTSIEQLNKLIALETSIQPILDLYAELSEVNKSKTNLTNDIKIIKNTILEKQKLEASIITKQAKFDKEMGDECILCGQTIEHKH